MILSGFSLSPTPQGGANPAPMHRGILTLVPSAVGSSEEALMPAMLPGTMIHKWVGHAGTLCPHCATSSSPGSTSPGNTPWSTPTSQPQLCTVRPESAPWARDPLYTAALLLSKDSGKCPCRMPHWEDSAHTAQTFRPLLSLLSVS